jgi:hypothetical protein
MMIDYTNKKVVRSVSKFDCFCQGYNLFTPLASGVLRIQCRNAVSEANQALCNPINATILDQQSD